MASSKTRSGDELPLGDPEDEPNNTITRDEIKSALAYDLLTTTITLRSNSNSNSNSKEEGIFWEIFSRLATVFNGPESRKILLFLWEHKATTSLEIATNLYCTRATISRTFNRLVSLRILTQKGTVGIPYFVRGDHMGPPPRVYALTVATDEEVLEAQKRYGELRPSNHVKDLDSDLVAKYVRLFDKGSDVNLRDIKTVLAKNPDLDPSKRVEYAEAIQRELTDRGVKVWG